MFQALLVAVRGVTACGMLSLTRGQWSEQLVFQQELSCHASCQMLLAPGSRRGTHVVVCATSFEEINYGISQCQESKSLQDEAAVHVNLPILVHCKGPSCSTP